MLNGVSKQIIEIKKTEDPYFERVIFIVNPEKSYVCEEEKNFRARRFIKKFSPSDKKHPERRRAAARVAFSAVKTIAAAAVGAAAAACFMHI